jgi:Asp-tRNA(Asn)/Glu-tRNA(Gln) amidotransferase A subunit family amidase
MEFRANETYTSVMATPLGNHVVEATRAPSLVGKRIGILREVFGSHKGITGVIDAALAKMVSAGANLVDVFIPNLRSFKASTSVTTARLASDINAFLASRQELSHLTIENIKRDGRYHLSVDLIETIAEAPRWHPQSLDRDQACEEQARFQQTVACVFTSHSLDAIVYPTCQILAPKTADVLNGRFVFTQLCS